jgi:hypothetical protein
MLLYQEANKEIKDMTIENKVLQKRLFAIQKRRSTIGTKLFLEGADTQYQIVSTLPHSLGPTCCKHAKTEICQNPRKRKARNLYSDYASNSATSYFSLTWWTRKTFLTINSTATAYCLYVK